MASLDRVVGEGSAEPRLGALGPRLFTSDTRPHTGPGRAGSAVQQVHCGWTDG